MVGPSQFRVQVVADPEMVTALEECYQNSSWESVDEIDGSVELEAPTDAEDELTVVANGDYEALVVDSNRLDEESLEAILERAPDVPVLALSGSDSQNLALDAERRGAHASLIAESPSQREFKRALQTAVRRHRVEQARDHHREQSILLGHLLSVDVRNDMESALNWSESALETVEESAGDDLERMATVCRHSKNLTAKVETIRSLVTDGDLTEELATVNLAQMIRSEITRLRQRETAVQFQLPTDFDAEVIVRGDELLGCALYTLLADAAHRASQETGVQVSIKTTDEEAIATVKDDGETPPTAKVDQLSSDRPAPDDPADDRLDAYFINQVIEGYGGEIAVRTEETAGTTIQVTLQRDSQQAGFEVDADLSERPDSDRLSTRVSMEETEIVFETDETTHRVDHDSIFDIANDVGEYSDPSESTKITIAYRNGQSTEAVTLHGRAGRLAKIQQIFFRTLLGSTPAKVQYQSREASQTVTGEVELTITSEQILLSTTEGTASVDRESIKQFNMREQSADDSDSQVITINHLKDGVPAKIDIAFRTYRDRNMFGRFLQANLDTGETDERRPQETVQLLLVEDDTADREMASLMLEKRAEELAIETASNAIEGYRKIKSTEFDCVISDYDMPKRDGIDLLQQVRETHPDLPFILFTGQGSEAVAKEAVLSDVTDYVQKGIGTNQYDILVDRVRKAIR